MRAVSLLFHDVYVATPGESGFQSKAADRYKLQVADFDAQIQGIAEIREDAPALVADLIACGAGPSGSPGGRERSAPPTNHPFLITVDDGGVSYYTHVADRLEARGWRGHCFISTDTIGCRGFLETAQIRELDARGHVIGSHSASHPARLSACPLETMQQEWSRSRQILEDLLGHAVMAASVPGGYYSRRVARTARDAGLQLLFTSEPTITVRDENGIAVVGRFTIRRGHAADTARRFVQPSPWTRYATWASWNAKGVVKPLLGPSYMRVADWILGGSVQPPLKLRRSAGPVRESGPASQDWLVGSRSDPTLAKAERTRPPCAPERTRPTSCLR